MYFTCINEELCSKLRLKHIILRRKEGNHGDIIILIHAGLFLLYDVSQLILLFRDQYVFRDVGLLVSFGRA